MEQRPLRLGDIVDDYCPRERRLTNHVIVAIVDDAIRQTRCSTCDTEHVYREARVPRRKKKDDTAALYDQVLADAGGQLVQPRAGVTEPLAEPPPAVAAAPARDSALAAPVAAAPMAADRQPPDEAGVDDAGSTDAAENQNGHHDLWPAHRRLIRATLPRTENDPPAARPIPEFTMHQRPPHRGGGFRHGHGAGQGWHGNGSGNGQPRHGGGQRHGRPNGEPDGNVVPNHGGRRSRHRGKHRRPR
jgi:hypothetical protein